MGDKKFGGGADSRREESYRWKEREEGYTDAIAFRGEVSLLLLLSYIQACACARVRPRLNGSGDEEGGLKAGNDGLETGEAVVMRARPM